MIILVDQDGVLADFDAGWQTQMRKLHPDAPDRDVHARAEFKIATMYQDEPYWSDVAQEITTLPGFFASLPPVPGAIEGLNALVDGGHEVYICTSPLTRWNNCVGEKHAWVEKELGPDWVRRLIITKDKSLVHGDILIDDKPHVTGVRTPDWTHVRYTRSYNAHLPGPRLTWETAAAVLDALPRVA